MMFTGSRGKKQARSGLERASDLVAWADESAVPTALAAKERLAQSTPPSARETWSDFAHRAADYYGLLGQVVDLGLDVAASEGFLPAEIAGPAAGDHRRRDGPWQDDPGDRRHSQVPTCGRRLARIASHQG